MSIFYTVINSLFSEDNSTTSPPTSRRSILQSPPNSKPKICQYNHHKPATKLSIQSPQYSQKLYAWIHAISNSVSNKAQMVESRRTTLRNESASPNLPIDNQQNPNPTPESAQKITASLQPATHAQSTNLVHASRAEPSATILRPPNDFYYFLATGRTNPRNGNARLLEQSTNSSQFITNADPEISFEDQHRKSITTTRHPALHAQAQTHGNPTPTCHPHGTKRNKIKRVLASQARRKNPIGTYMVPGVAELLDARSALVLVVAAEPNPKPTRLLPCAPLRAGASASASAGDAAAALVTTMNSIAANHTPLRAPGNLGSGRKRRC